MRNFLIFIALLCTVFCSCNERTISPTPSDREFDSIVLVADRLGDSGHVDQALNLAREAYHRLKDLSVDGKVRYFTYCNVIYNNRKEYDKSIQLADSMLAILDWAGESPAY